MSVPTYGNAFRGARFEISPVESVCSSSKEDNDEGSGSNLHDFSSDFHDPMSESETMTQI